MRKAAIVCVAVLVVIVAEARLWRSEPNNEVSAIGALKAVAAAQASYAGRNGGYAGDLAALSKGCPGSRPFVGPDLASDPSRKAGYQIALAPGPAARRVSSDCNGATTYSGFYATATPLPPGGGGRPAFGVDEAMTIWRDTSGIAPTPPFTEAGTVKAVR
jgi:hypothetical protein